MITASMAGIGAVMCFIFVFSFLQGYNMTSTFWQIVREYKDTNKALELWGVVK